MTLNIDVTPREEAWLAAQAERFGLPPAEIVKRLIDAQLPAVATNAETVREVDAKSAAAIALLDSWITEGANADEDTKRQAERELEELKEQLNANRAELGERRVFP
jgi:hypothetical protein